MKNKCLAFIFMLLISNVVFAQSFDSSKESLLGVISASQNCKDVDIEFIDYDSEKDLTYFTYTWIQETKLLMSKSYTQYRCLLNVSSEENGSDKKLVTKIDNSIFYRMVNADGSEIQGTPKTSGVTYVWAENKTMLNKKKVLDSVIEEAEKRLYAELNKNDEEINNALISFFSDGVNVALFDTDKLASMALKYPSLCSSPAVVWKIHVGKSEMWYENYLETIKNATFVNDLTIFEINKSEKPEYKYLVKANIDFCHFTKEDFNELVKKYNGVYSMANFGESIELSKARRDSYNTYKSIGGSKRITIHYYTNDNKFIDMNKGDVFKAKGTLQSINAPGIFKEISFYEVFEN